MKNLRRHRHFHILPHAFAWCKLWTIQIIHVGDRRICFKWTRWIYTTTARRTATGPISRTLKVLQQRLRLVDQQIMNKDTRTTSCYRTRQQQRSISYAAMDEGKLSCLKSQQRPSSRAAAGTILSKGIQFKDGYLTHIRPSSDSDGT